MRVYRYWGIRAIVFVSIYLAGKSTAPLLGGGRRARREARRKRERVDLSRLLAQRASSIVKAEVVCGVGFCRVGNDFEILNMYAPKIPQTKAPQAD